MKYFDTKKSLPVLCSLLIAACSGGGGGGNKAPQSPIEKHAAVAPKTQKAAENPALAAQAPVVNKAVVAAPESIVSASVAPSPTAKPTTTSVTVKTETMSTQPEKAMEDRSERSLWKGECKSATICNNNGDASNDVTVYTLTLIENATPQYSTTDKLVSKTHKITLKLGNNKEKDYNFTLLGENDNPVGYYGYRHTIGNKPDAIQAEVLYAIDSQFESKQQHPQMKANYKKERGFIYAATHPTNHGTKNYGDVELVYDMGKISGKIYDSAFDKSRFKKPKIFNIETQNDTVVIKPLENLQGTIQPGDRAELKYIFADSQKGKADHKYIFGIAKGDSWAGVLSAEKLEDKTKQ
ncbi:hypothetical protein ACNO7K_10785 [Bisgaard Taxon 45]